MPIKSRLSGDEKVSCLASKLSRLRRLVRFLFGLSATAAEASQNDVAGWQIFLASTSCTDCQAGLTDPASEPLLPESDFETMDSPDAWDAATSTEFLFDARSSVCHASSANPLPAQSNDHHGPLNARNKRMGGHAWAILCRLPSMMRMALLLHLNIHRLYCASLLPSRPLTLFPFRSWLQSLQSVLGLAVCEEVLARSKNKRHTPDTCGEGQVQHP